VLIAAQAVCQTGNVSIPGRRRRYDSGVADLADLTAEDFRPLLHERFGLTGGAQGGHNGGDVSFEVELVEVTVIPRDPNGRAPFSLEFQGDPEHTLPQGIYKVEHERLGALEIFLVPIARGRYEAVFT
jgi:hypothetical protein